MGTTSSLARFPRVGRLHAAQAALSGATVAALERLAHLFGLGVIEKQAGDFMEDGYCSGAAGWLYNVRGPESLQVPNEPHT